jgi:hypothetical protein
MVLSCLLRSLPQEGQKINSSFLGIDDSLKAWKKYLAIKIPATNRINIPKRGKAGHILGPK